MNTAKLLATFLLAACAAADIHRGDLVAQAELDLRCPHRQLSIEQLDGQPRQNGEQWQPASSGAVVRGCGQRATYAWSGTAWLLTSSTATSTR